MKTLFKISFLLSTAGIFCACQETQHTPWNIERIRALEAWEVTRGAGVGVCIIDSSFFIEHPDLVDAISGSISVAPKTQPDELYESGNHHGTHVAGIIGARDNSIGVVGVAPETDLFLVRYSNQYGDDNVAAALSWCLDQNVGVINISHSWPGVLEETQEAFAAAVASDVVIIASRGNEADDAPMFPASWPGIVSVLAIDKDDELASFSSLGSSELTIGGPGVHIRSTWGKQNYHRLNGTSMAAPHVAGVAALVRAAQPDLYAKEVIEVLLDSAEDLGLPFSQQGVGMVDALHALQLAEAYAQRLDGAWASD